MDILNLGLKVSGGFRRFQEFQAAIHKEVFGILDIGI